MRAGVHLRTPALFCTQREGLRRETTTRDYDTRLQCLDQFVRLLSRIHLGMGLHDRSARIDHIGDTIGGFGVTAVAGAIGDADRAFDIAQQRIGELVLLSEPGVGFDVVGADAEYLHILALIFLDSITESNPLSRSPTGTGAGVKPENDCFVRVVVQVDDGTCVVLNREPGRLVADIEHPLSPEFVPTPSNEGWMLTQSLLRVKA